MLDAVPEELATNTLAILKGIFPDVVKVTETASGKGRQEYECVHLSFYNRCITRVWVD